MHAFFWCHQCGAMQTLSCPVENSRLSTQQRSAAHPIDERIFKFSQLPKTAAPGTTVPVLIRSCLIPQMARPAAHSSAAAVTCFVSYLEKFVVTLGRHQEASILKLHLPVLQQVVQNRQNVPLRLFQAFQDEYPTFCSRTNCTLFPRDRSNRRPSDMVERGLALLAE